jgi:hypothetical protein
MFYAEPRAITQQMPGFCTLAIVRASGAVGGLRPALFGQSILSTNRVPFFPFLTAAPA